MLRKRYQTPLAALRGIVVLPGERVSFDVGRSVSVNAVNAAIKNNDGLIVLVAQKDILRIHVTEDDLYEVGTLCKIAEVFKKPDSSDLKVAVEGIKRVDIVTYDQSEPYFIAVSEETEAEEMDHELFDVMKKKINGVILKLVKEVKNRTQDDTQAGMIVDIDSQAMGRLMQGTDLLVKLTKPDVYAFAVTSAFISKPDQRQKVLNPLDDFERLQIIYSILQSQIEMLSVDRKIDAMVKEQVDRNQKEYILREKIRAIKKELGEDESSEADEFRRRMSEKNFPDSVKERLKTEIDRFSMLPSGSHESPMARQYIECLLDLPWTEMTEDSVDIKEARRILDEDHYGMTTVKDRILEYLAVAKTTGNVNGQIICFVGPPGVGKTSISSSIAKSIGRNFVRMSLGGIDDEAEIRGHRRTYIGAMPGRIITAMKQAGTVNPVILFDEIDKLNKNVHGDPAAAMLEVLDSAQNSTFRDHFLELPYDLSKVMFITTANSLDTIPRPLLDRMEVIEVPGYLEYEKVKIAEKHLIPKQLKKHGLTKTQLSIPEDALKRLIDGYTRESGVRTLERTIASVCRKAACEIVDGKQRIRLNAKKLTEYLGAPKYIRDEISIAPGVGACTGLAWTSVGGETLVIEVQPTKGNGTVKITGQLGDVMKESTEAALTYVKAHSDELGIADDYFSTHDLHIHVPEGATPKDGPSAGITIMTAIASAASGKPVRGALAMTGEITLRGNVLAIGGLREKLLAAIRAGVTDVIVPEKNRANISKLEEEITDNLNIIFASNAREVISYALMYKSGADVIAAGSIPLHSRTPAVSAPIE